MAENETGPGWVWVLMRSGGEEGVYALKEEQSGRKFIPVFQSQEDAVVGRSRLDNELRSQYEVEAMNLAFAAAAARRDDADIYIIDGDGRVIERLTPAPQA